MKNSMLISHKSHGRFGSPGRQRGVVAVVTALVLLIIVTIVTVYVAKVVVMEQRISANEVRAKEAFEAADAGMNYAIGYLGMSGGTDHDDDGVIDSGIQPAGANYTVTIADAGSFATDGIVRVTSVGSSDDGTGSHTIVQEVHVTSALGGSATHPLITRGLVGFSGNVSVINRETNATIWAGGELTSWGSGGTFIADGTFEADGVTPSVVQSSGKFGNETKTGVDVIDNSAELSSISDGSDDFFNNFFSGSKDFTRNIATYQTTDTGLVDSGGASIPGSMIWVDAPDSGFSLSNGTYGTVADPIILIVDGDLDLRSGPDINGFVYVTGDVSGGGGNVNITGALIVEGELQMSGGGTFIVEFDSNTLTNLGIDHMSASRLPGTWRDW